MWQLTPAMLHVVSPRLSLRQQPPYHRRGCKKWSRCNLASHQVEYYDEELDQNLVTSVFILTQPLRTLQGFHLSRGDAASHRGNLVDFDGKFVICLGGDHKALPLAL